MKVFGYARVSTRDQNLDLQIEALQKVRCDEIFVEKVSGRAKVRSEFEKLLGLVRSGDVIAVWRTDRLGRRTLELIQLLAEFKERGIHLVSISQGIDTRTSMGRLFFKIAAVLSENELEVLIERTHAGLESARARGRVGGKPKGLTEKAKGQAQALKILYDAKQISVVEICKRLEIGSKTTFYKYLDYERERLKSLEK